MKKILGVVFAMLCVQGVYGADQNRKVEQIPTATVEKYFNQLKKQSKLEGDAFNDLIKATAHNPAELLKFAEAEAERKAKVAAAASATPAAIKNKYKKRGTGKGRVVKGKWDK